MKIEVENNLLTVSFEEGEPVTMDISLLSDETKHQGMIAGVSRKVANYAANALGISTASEAETRTVEQIRRDLVVEGIEKLQTVGWKAPSEPRAKKTPKIDEKIKTAIQNLQLIPAGKKRRDALNLLNSLLGFSITLSDEELDF